MEGTMMERSRCEDMREKYRQKDWEAEKRAREICGGRDLLKDWRLMMSHRVVVRQTLSPFWYVD